MLISGYDAPPPPPPPPQLGTRQSVVPGDFTSGVDLIVIHSIFWDISGVFY